MLSAKRKKERERMRGGETEREEVYGRKGMRGRLYTKTCIIQAQVHV